MPTINVHVKWQKEKFSDVEVDTAQPPLEFKSVLYSLSGVPPERQKVMLRGGVLGDHEWGKLAAQIKPNVTLMMMGSADALPAQPQPAERTKFVEDMDEGELNRALQVPPGLNNLGNTCYMNACLQCLRSIPELCDSLRRHQPARGGAATSDVMLAGRPQEALVSALRSLFGQLDSAGEAMSPMVFLTLLHRAFPQLSTRGEHGFQQQDANECWTELVRCLQQHLKAVLPPTVGAGVAGHAELGGSVSDRYLGGVFECRMHCTEAEDEPVLDTRETFYQLSCFIDKDVKYLHTGLRAGLEGQITKHSAGLDRDAVYSRKSLIARLPAYLSVQFVRFYYKEKENVNAKVLKDIKFPLRLDVYDMCTEALQKRLAPKRDLLNAQEEAEALRVKKAKLAAKDVKAGDNASLPSGQAAVDETPEVEPFSFPDDPGSCDSGLYELQAVLTHQGRSSSSGHYVAWVRKNAWSDVWHKFDDEDVTSVSSEDILRLSGGGDWHCAYVLLYGPRLLKKGGGRDDAAGMEVDSASAAVPSSTINQ